MNDNLIPFSMVMVTSDKAEIGLRGYHNIEGTRAYLEYFLGMYLLMKSTPDGESWSAEGSVFGLDEAREWASHAN